MNLFENLQLMNETNELITREEMIEFIKEEWDAEETLDYVYNMLDDAVIKELCLDVQEYLNVDLKNDNSLTREEMIEFIEKETEYEPQEMLDFIFETIDNDVIKDLYLNKKEYLEFNSKDINESLK